MTDPTFEDSSRQPIQRLWVVLLVLGLGTLVAAIALVFISSGDDDPSDDAESLQIGWAIADGEELAGTLLLSADPASEGENEVQIDIDPEPGGWLADLQELDVRFLPLRGSAEEQSLLFDISNDEQRAMQTIDFGGSEQWEVQISSVDRTLANIFLMLPDPNLHGEGAPALVGDDPAAVQLYQQASANVASWHRVRYEQQLSDGSGLAVVSFRDVNDGADGSTPGFRYHTPGGLDAYVLGTTAWSRYPGEAWEVRDTNAMIPPSEWGGEYLGATDFQVGPVSNSPDGSCRMITFVVPGSERQAIAWYAWCIDEETGQVRRDAMISRAHYMITEFSDINGEIEVQPPADAPPAPAGTPAEST